MSLTKPLYSLKNDKQAAFGPVKMAILREKEMDIMVAIELVKKMNIGMVATLAGVQTVLLGKSEILMIKIKSLEIPLPVKMLVRNEKSGLQQEENMEAVSPQQGKIFLVLQV